MAFMPRATHVLQWSVQRAATARAEANPKKADLSTDWSLQLDSMKVESLVIADQHAAVNTFPGLVHTARHATKAARTRSRCPNPQGMEPPKVLVVIGVKS